MMSVAALKRKDEKGYTLQTLIVTAVLVVLAIGVTVVIVSLTRSANDSTEDAASQDMAPREAQYGVILQNGSVSYDWRCGIHQEFIIGQGETHGRCLNRCWITLSASGRVKWDYNNHFDSRVDPPVFRQNSEKHYFGTTANYFQTPANIPAKRTYDVTDDYDSIVYSQSGPAGAIEAGGNVIVDSGVCYHTSSLCDMNELKREALIRRMQAAKNASDAGNAPPLGPGIDMTRFTIKCA